MSIDLTNSDKLDTSPLVDRYSNVLAKGSPTTKPTLVRINIIPRTAIQQAPKNISRVAPAPVVTAPVVTPVITPPVVVLPTAPAPAPSGGGGGGAPSGSDKAPDKNSDEIPTATPATPMAQGDDKDFYMKMWFWGLLVGGIAGYLYAKKTGKDFKSFALIGAGIGGFGGLVIEKSMNKANVTVVTAVPSGQSNQADEQQESGQSNQADEQQEQQ